MTENPIHDFYAHDVEMESALELLPVCDGCGERIQDDYCYVVDGQTYCEECINEIFRRNVTDFIL